MVKDGYEDITNIDISSVAIEMMRRKYECMPQLNCILLGFYILISDTFLLLLPNSGYCSLMKLNRHANGC